MLHLKQGLPLEDATFKINRGRFSKINNIVPKTKHLLVSYVVQKRANFIENLKQHHGKSLLQCI